MSKLTGTSLILQHYTTAIYFIFCWINRSLRVRTFSLSGGGHSGLQFSWRTRSSICIGVARGLAFLHEEVRPYIVHRDIKASNILLDRNLNPKIADFGLAKLIPANMTHVSTRVAGTMWVSEFLFSLVTSCICFQSLVFSQNPSWTIWY